MRWTASGTRETLMDMDIRQWDGHEADIQRSRSCRRNSLTPSSRPSPPRTTGNRISYDTDVKGFGCRVTANGRPVLRHQLPHQGWSRAALHHRAVPRLEGLGGQGRGGGPEEAGRPWRRPDGRVRGRARRTDGRGPLRALRGGAPSPTPASLTHRIQGADRQLHPAGASKPQGGRRHLQRHRRASPEGQPSARLTAPTGCSRSCRRCSRWRSSGDTAPTARRRESSATRKSNATAICPATSSAVCRSRSPHTPTRPPPTSFGLLLLTGARRGEVLGHAVGPTRPRGRCVDEAHQV